MECYTSKTGKLTKTGKESIRRAFFHKECDELHKNDEEFKAKESEELDELYQYILKMHNLEVMDGRMFMKVQDLRNGTISLNRKKVRRYKEGVEYSRMLLTYKHIENRIDQVLRSMDFANKWNEFSYVFSMMVNNLNETSAIQKRNNRVKTPSEIVSDDFDIQVRKRPAREDSMDINHLL